MKVKDPRSGELRDAPNRCNVTGRIGVQAFLLRFGAGRTIDLTTDLLVRPGATEKARCTITVVSVQKVSDTAYAIYADFTDSSGVQPDEPVPPKSIFIRYDFKTHKGSLVYEPFGF